MTDKTIQAAPVAPSERIVSLDALRGFAVLGILIMNIQSFSMIEAAYLNPTAYGDLTGLNKLVWTLSHIFADEKFMSIFSMFFGAQLNYWGSIFVAVGYVSVVMLVCKAVRTGLLMRALAATGRMALTNYIVQSVICTTIFYGHGLGLFGAMERKEQILVVFCVWAFQLVISPIWLSRFRFGPLEWLWRSLTYRSRQPMRIQR